MKNNYLHQIKLIFLSIALFLSTYLLNAQIASPVSPAMQPQHDAVFGPTLIICSNLPNSNGTQNDYFKSKTNVFGLPVPASLTPTDNTNTQYFNSTGYVLVRVGDNRDNLTPDPVNDNGAQTIQKATYWRYLDEAVNFFLSKNYQRIIILEGEYEVNGPIIINNLNGSTAEVGTGRITIEGEGFGTRIKNAATYTTGNIFEVRSYFNTIKNLSIISNNTNTCLALTSASSTVDVRHNVFENLYIGVQTMVSNDTPVAGRKGILINSDTKQIGYNRFKNITFNSVATGIELQGSLRLHDNHFENLIFENTIVGIEFVSGVAAYDNIFDNLTLQTDSYSKNLVKNVSGRHNLFNALNHNDWGNTALPGGAQSGHSLVTIASTAEHTTIQNSEVGRGTVVYLTDNGKYTQLINNYGGNSDITYRLGNDTNPDNTSAISKVEVLGNFVSSMDGTTQLIADKGRVIIGSTNAVLVGEINSLPSAYKLIVNGKMRVKEEIYVKNAGLTWPDYVFEDNYKLLSLSEVEKYINEKGYLPNMPSAAEVEQDGVALSEMVTLQQEKIEELTLYLIDMKKELNALKNKQL